jgi:hypothetical protein
MTRLTEAEGRQRWNEAIRARGWQKSKLRLAMFDYRTAEHGPTLYRPAPAWATIAADDGTALIEDYVRIEESLLAQGEPYSRRAAAAHGGTPYVQLVAKPISVSKDEIVATIARVMEKVHPLAITQEQILRAAFFAHLPPELGQTIGTVEAAIYPERPTPSCDYIFTGTRGIGMRARYDLGFGHPSESDGISGVTELKGGLGTFDRLETLSQWEENPVGLETADGETDKLEEPLLLDLLKLLDPNLPESAFRISWIASGKRGRSTGAEIYDRTIKIVERVAKQRNQSGTIFRIDPATGWLVCTWPLLKLQLDLTWYRPEANNPEKFEPVFAAGVQ